MDPLQQRVFLCLRATVFIFDIILLFQGQTQPSKTEIHMVSTVLAAGLGHHASLYKAACVLQIDSWLTNEIAKGEGCRN